MIRPTVRGTAANGDLLRPRTLPEATDGHCPVHVRAAVSSTPARTEGGVDREHLYVIASSHPCHQQSPTRPQRKRSATGWGSTDEAAHPRQRGRFHCPKSAHNNAAAIPIGIAGRRRFRCPKRTEGSR